MNAQSSPTVWEWILDRISDSALSFTMGGNKQKDIERFTYKLADVSCVLEIDKTIIQKTSNLLHRYWRGMKVDDKIRRLLLTCIALFITTGGPPCLTHIFSDNDGDEIKTLVMTLRLIDKTIPIFQDLEKDQLDKMWFYTFKQIAKDSTMSKQIENFMTNCSQYISKDNLKNSESYAKGVKLRQIDCDRVDYVHSMLVILQKLNSLLEVPFLVKIEKKFSNTFNANQTVSKKMAQEIGELAHSTMTLLTDDCNDFLIESYDDDDNDSISSDESNVKTKECDSTDIYSDIYSFADKSFPKIILTRIDDPIEMELATCDSEDFQDACSCSKTVENSDNESKNLSFNLSMVINDTALDSSTTISEKSMDLSLNLMKPDHVHQSILCGH